jgi:L-threonylcarbamoyladenylate synthase
MNDYPDDIENAVRVLKEGGIILYPTDTIWGIGCDATNASAIKRIYHLKKREEKKSMIILLPSLAAIKSCVENPPQKLIDFIKTQTVPTTGIYGNAKNLPDVLINQDGTIAIRIPQNEFCIELLTNFQKPIVSTSANISGDLPPANFSEINPLIKNSVDYVVRYRQSDIKKAIPSSIIKLSADGAITKIR